MKVVFRVDSSLLIGSGHVMRCLVLAEGLKAKGYDVVFACSPLEGDMRSFINERGFEVVTLRAPQTKVMPSHGADYLSWLQKSISEDSKDFLAAVRKADLVITDHYAIGKEWQTTVIQALKCRLFAIDDLARCHQADLILDQTLGRLEIDYKDSKTRVITGSAYALLQASFSSKRELALSRVLINEQPEVLVSMGGVDAPNATLKVLKTLHHQVNANFTVLLSPRAPHFKEVQEWCARHSNVTHLEFVSDMASLMLEHDIAIGAPGTTSWERACLGLPNVIVPLAENQTMICEQLTKHNAAIKVSVGSITERLLCEYQRTLKHWKEFKEANLILCDGRGMRRTVFEIEQLLNSQDTNKFRLEPASQLDIKLVYEWQCHPETRKYALTPDIPCWDTHQTWMSNKLKSASDYFYMVTDKTNSDKVGVVRLDRITSGCYLVSIFIDPDCYGRGIALAALEVVDSIHPDITLHATVLKANLASQRLFKKAGYQQVDDETYIRQPIY